MNRIQRISITVGTLLWILIVSSFLYAKKEEQVLETSLIRFHVLAHSDEPADQEIKYKVRDAILENYKEEFQKLKTVEEARQYLHYRMADIQKIAEETIKAEGYAYGASVSLATDAFPTKQYGNITLPAGYYQSLRIALGEAGGHNWWCVMFPAICYTMEEETLPAHMEDALEKALDEETNAMIHYEEADTSIQFRFKIVELWNRLEQWITT